MVKTYDRFTTVRWLEQNKVELEKILYPNDEKREAFVRNLGNYAEKIIETLPKNAYELCMNKIISIDDVIQVNGKMYEDFEEAKYYFETYRSKENVGLPKSMIDLHSIMNFVYLGRRKIEPDMK